ncbi:MAG: hypothetical protein KatS3mg061_1956 [Dehalococcoidia bacterium]|nr:MAG: hypothetical protein KatS3mg061_1956 [Dehalococcoidia bacterium]
MTTGASRRFPAPQPEPSSLSGQLVSEPTVISMDPDDDIGSLREKLDQAESRRVVLVVPRRAALLRNPVRLKLLRRYARQVAREVAIVSEDGEIRRLARAEGFHVASSPRQVRFQASGSPLTLPSLSAGGAIAVALTAGVLGVAALLLAALVVPSATVELAPVATAASEVVTVKASRQARGVNADQRTIAARLITAEAEATETAEATGKKSSPAEKARGRVTLTNRNPQENGAVGVPRGALLRTLGNIQFTTDEAVTVPASTAPIQVAVTAVEPGVSGNVPARSITAFVEPALQSRLAVVNEQPLSGGSQSETPYVTLADRNRLRQSIIEKLRNEGYARLYEAKRENESIYRETVQVTVTEETFDRLLDEEARTVSIVAKARVSAIAFTSDDVIELGQRVAAARLIEGQQVLPGSLMVAPLGLVGFDDDAVTFNLRLTYQVIRRLNEGQLKAAIAGRTVSEATTYLANSLDLVRPPTITLWPSFAPWLPRLPARIELRIVGS